LIERMSLYRSIALHCLGDTNPIFGDVYKIAVSNSPFGCLYRLAYPLYDNIEWLKDIEKKASKYLLENPAREEAERYLQLQEHTDALEFCFDSFARLLQVAESLESETNLKSSDYIITDKVIIELKVTTEGGMTKHYKRSPESGNLEEI